MMIVAEFLAMLFLVGCQTTDSKETAGIEMIEGPTLEQLQGNQPEIRVNPNPGRGPVTEWERGDILGAQTLCRDEKAIMRIVMGDTKSALEVKKSIYSMTMIGECVIVPQPIAVPILDIVGEYTDFAKRPSVVLRVATPSWIEGDEAYIIAGGRRGPPKEEKGKAI